jgi:hypothetical protein
LGKSKLEIEIGIRIRNYPTAENPVGCGKADGDASFPSADRNDWAALRIPEIVFTVS